MSKNCIIKSDEGFFTASNKWSLEYPDALLMDEGEADRKLAEIECSFNDYEPMQIIQDYGLDSEIVLYSSEDWH